MPRYKVKLEFREPRYRELCHVHFIFVNAWSKKSARTKARQFIVANPFIEMLKKDTYCEIREAKRV